MSDVERVARVFDPRAWEPENMVPTRAITTAMHQRRQDSCVLARAAMLAHLDCLMEPGMDVVDDFKVEGLPLHFWQAMLKSKRAELEKPDE